MRYWAKIFFGAVLVGPLDLDLHVEAAGAQDRGVDEILAVRRTDHDHVLQALDAVDLGEELWHDRALDVGRDACAPRAEQRVHLVEEHDDGIALFGLLTRALEDQANLALGLADVLVEELRALDVEEVGTRFLVAGLLGDAARQRVRDRLRDERLPATGRAVQQDALRRLQLVLEEHVRVEVRQLDCVLDHLDLFVETTDVGVGDVGDLLEHELFDLGARQPLGEQAGPRVHEHVIARAQLHADQLFGELAHALFVGAADDEGAGAARHELLQHDDFARDVGAARQDDVQRFVERDLLRRCECRRARPRGARTPASFAPPS